MCSYMQPCQSRLESKALNDALLDSTAVVLRRSTGVIEVQHLTKRYGRVTAVDDVSFRVERGEILGFLGPNGAGKTTTMRILTGYMPATDGQGDRRRLRRLRAAARGQAPHRLPAGDAAALPRHDRPRVPRRSSPASRACPRASARRASTRVMERTRVADMAEPALREALEGLPAARRPRAGADSQPRRADPRRADRRPRPEADHRDARADQGAGRRPHHHPQHAHPPRGRRRPASASSSSTTGGSSRSTRPTT